MPVKDQTSLQSDLDIALKRLEGAQAGLQRTTLGDDAAKWKAEILKAEGAVKSLTEAISKADKGTEAWGKHSAFATNALLDLSNKIESQARSLQNLQKTQVDYVLSLESVARTYSTTVGGLRANIKQLEELRSQMNMTRAEALKMGDAFQGAIARGFDKGKLVEFQKALIQAVGREQGLALSEKVLQKEARSPGFVAEAQRGSERAYSVAAGDKDLRQAIAVLSNPRLQTVGGRQASGIDAETHWLSSIGDKISEKVADFGNSTAGRAVPWVTSGAGSIVKTGAELYLLKEMTGHLRQIVVNTGGKLSGAFDFLTSKKTKLGKFGRGFKLPRAKQLRTAAQAARTARGIQSGSSAIKAGASLVNAGKAISVVGTGAKLAKGLASGGLGLVAEYGGGMVGDYLQQSPEGTWTNMAGKGVSAASRIGGFALGGAALGSVVPVLGTTAGAIGGGLIGAGLEAYNYFTSSHEDEVGAVPDKGISAGFADEILSNTKDQLQQALALVEDSYEGYMAKQKKATVDYYQAIGSTNVEESTKIYEEYLTQTKAASANFITEARDRIKTIDEEIRDLGEAGRLYEGKDAQGNNINSTEYKRLLEAKSVAETSIQEEQTKTGQLEKFGARFAIGADVNERARALAQAKLQSQEASSEMAKLMGLPFEAIVTGAQARANDAKYEIERLEGEIAKAQKIKETSSSPVAVEEAEAKIAELNAKKSQQRVTILKTQLQTTAELFQAINDLPDIQLNKAQIEGVRGRREVAGAIGGLSAADARSLGREEADLAKAEYDTRRKETDRIKSQAQEQIRALEADQSLKPEERGAAIKSQQAIIQKADNEVLQSQAASIKAEKQAKLEGLQIEREIMNSRRETLETEKGTADYLGASYSQIYDIQKGIVSAAQEQRQNTLAQMQEMERLGAEANDPEYVKLQAQYARETADIMKASMAAQRDFLDKALGKAFGVGQGSRFQPLVNTRMLLGGNYRQTESGLQIAEGPRTLNQGAFEAQGNPSRRLGTGAGRSPKVDVGGQIVVKLEADRDGIKVALRQQFLEATSVSGMA